VLLGLGGGEQLSAGAIAADDQHLLGDGVLVLAGEEADDVDAGAQGDIRLEGEFFRILAVAVGAVEDLAGVDEDVAVEDTVAVGGHAGDLDLAVAGG
jgi:hypothetical protein